METHFKDNENRESNEIIFNKKIEIVSAFYIVLYVITKTNLFVYISMLNIASYILGS